MELIKLDKIEYKEEKIEGKGRARNKKWLPEEDEFHDSDNPSADHTRRSYTSIPDGGGDFWEEIDTRVQYMAGGQVVNRLVTRENMAVVVTRPSDKGNSGFNDIREAYEHDRGLVQTQQNRDLRSMLQDNKFLSAQARLNQKESLMSQASHKRNVSTGGGKNNQQVMSGGGGGTHHYTEEEVQRIKADCEKKITKLKKAAEVQMRNVKLMAKDRARKLMEDTVNRIKKQF